MATTHQEECHKCIKEDAADKAKIRETLSTCIDILNHSEHPDRGFISIFSGHVNDNPTVNAHEAVKVGAANLQVFKNVWSSNFHLKLKKKVKKMAKIMKVWIKIREVNKVIDTESIHACVFSIMASSRDSIPIETLFSHELAPQSTALFNENEGTRTTSKAILKKQDTGFI